MFKVKPVNKYPEEYMKCIEVAKKELEEGAQPEIKESLSDIDSYDTVYVGFPNW